MKGYNTTLSCWVPGEGRLILLCPEWVRFLLLQASEDHQSHRWTASLLPLQHCSVTSLLQARWQHSAPHGQYQPQLSNCQFYHIEQSGWRIVIMTAIRCWRLLLHAYCCRRAAVMSNYCSCIYYAWHELTFSEKGRESQTFRSWPDNPT